ncbi:MAG: malto-oligosyltrehalose trehalohydrolase [Parachlamydiales bacterium]|jgi:maltooligosyltrehalose trehalohydrolase
MTVKRKYPIGAEIFPEGVHFRVWAPDHKKVDLVIEKPEAEPIYLPMEKEKKGYFYLLTDLAAEGTYYRFRLSDSQTFFSDPASRCQPQGPHGFSCVVNPHYHWTDNEWKGVAPQGHIVYELHIGTFTQEGTFAAATKELTSLANLGITLVEVLPLNDFPGHFGWGYDGVNLFAPSHQYGTPKDLKNFINRAHQLGIGVVLDVVYNHLGPEGNQMISFAKEYLSDKFSTDWGKAINFDSQESRNYFLTNAEYWIQEYHFDGLRVDATPWFFCSTPVHILQDLTRVVKKAGGKRKTITIGENEPQDTRLLKPYEEGGYGFDMLWNDDFHHSAVVRLTGKREAYYTDYLGSPQEFISSLKYGFLYQGQYYDWQKKPRGTPNLKIPRHSMVIFLENHDQVANSGYGLRLHQKADPGIYKALSTLLLLSPNTPLIFQGQEFNSSQPFYYFADHAPDISPLVKTGRKNDLAQFPRLGTSEIRKVLPDPGNPLTFTKSKLNHNEKDNDPKILNLYKDLIQLRKKDPIFSIMQNLSIDGAVLGTDAFLIRYFGEEKGDRVLIINFGADLYLNPSPEPLLVPGLEQEFEVLWSSESLCYGGEGTPPINIPYWKILGHSAIVLATKPIGKRKRKI